MDLTPEQTDEQLMGRVAAGDAAALQALYDRYASLALGALLRLTADRLLAEDLLQETFWRVWDKAGTFVSERGAFRPWLFSIARRQAIDALRRQKVRPEAAQTEQDEQRMAASPSPEPAVEEAAWLEMERKRVRQALADLPPEQYRVLELAYFQGLTRQEIAEVTGEPLGTVHTRARLGLQRLRALLPAEADD